MTDELRAILAEFLSWRPIADAPRNVVVQMRVPKDKIWQRTQLAVVRSTQFGTCVETAGIGRWHALDEQLVALTSRLRGIDEMTAEGAEYRELLP